MAMGVMLIIFYMDMLMGMLDDVSVGRSIMGVRYDMRMDMGMRPLQGINNDNR
mgnify:CR=1 FL=1